MAVGEDSVQYRKRKNHCFLVAAMVCLGRLEAFFLDVRSYALNKCSF